MKTIRQIFRILLCLTAALSVSCAGSRFGPDDLRLRFAVIGNTSPESPFSGFMQKFSDLISAVNTENPVIVIHTGNMIHGGHDWMGINEKDMERQFALYFSRIQSIKSTVYDMPGEKDCFNASSALYEKYSGKGSRYSFNYDKIHILMVPLVNMVNLSLESQISWIEEDLRKHRSSQSILVITHMPLFNNTGAHLQDAAAERVHGIFRKYPVKAVLSGSSAKMHETVKDNIRYIVTGCGGFSAEEKHKNLFQYYMVIFNGQEIFVEGKKL